MEPSVLRLPISWILHATVNWDILDAFVTKTLTNVVFLLLLVRMGPPVETQMVPIPVSVPLDMRGEIAPSTPMTVLYDRV